MFGKRKLISGALYTREQLCMVGKTKVNWREGVLEKEAVSSFEI
jgi:hypothetical protein